MEIIYYITFFRGFGYTYLGMQRQEIAGVICLFLILTLIFYLLTGSGVFYLVDISLYFYPAKFFLREALRNKFSPLWNPYTQLGVPYLLDFSGSGYFTPLNLLFLLPFSFPQLFKFFIFLHLTLAGWSTWLLGRELWKDNLVGILMGVSYMFNGYFLAQVIHLNIFCFLSWLPLIFWGVFRIFRRRDLPSSLLLSIILFFSLTQSNFQLLLYTFYFLFFLLLYEVRKKKEERFRITLLLTLGIVMGMLLSAYEILPMRELVRESLRKGGLSYEGVTSFSLFPYHLLTGIFPRIFGIYPDYIGKPYFWEQYWYVGLIPLMFIPIAFAYRKEKPYVSFFFYSAIIFFLLALGRYTPLYRFIYHLPGLKYFRVPARWISLASFSLIVAGGGGLKIFLEKREEEKTKILLHRLKLTFSLVLILSVIFLLLRPMLTPLFRDLIIRMYQGEIPSLGLIKGAKGGMEVEYYFGVMDKFFNFLLRSLISFFLIGVFSLLLLHFYWRKRIPLIHFFVGLLLLTTSDLLYHNRSLNPVRDFSYFLEPSPSEKFLLKDKSLFRIYSPYSPVEVSLELFGLWGSLRNIPSIGTSAYYSLEPYRFYKFRKVWEEKATKHKGQLGEEAIKLLSLLNVKYIITDSPLKDKVLVLRYSRKVRLLSFQGKPLEYNLHIYENPLVLPRAFVVQRSVRIREEEILDFMASKNFNPSREVILPGEREKLPDNSPGYFTPASIIHYAPDEVKIKVKIPQPGYLVLSDLYYPGWEVWVDGRKDKIYRVNYLLRGVYLPAGEHIVSFRFSSHSFHKGLGISITTFLMIMGIWIAGRIWKKGKK